MLKKFVISVFCVLFIFGCSKKEVDINSFYTKAMDELNLNDKLISVDSSKVQSLLYIDYEVEGLAAISKENKADMLFIIKAKDNKSLYNDINSYLSIVKEQNIAYKPSDVKKIDDAILLEKNGYIVVIVCDDYDKANELIGEF